MTDLPDECGVCGNTTEVDLLRSLLSTRDDEAEALRAILRDLFAPIPNNRNYVEWKRGEIVGRDLTPENEDWLATKSLAVRRLKAIAGLDVCDYEGEL